MPSISVTLSCKQRKWNTKVCYMCQVPSGPQPEAGWWQNPFVSVIVITNWRWWRPVLHGSRDTSMPQKNLGYSCLFSVGRPWDLTRALQINLFMLIIQNWTWVIIRPDMAAKLWPVAKINPRIHHKSIIPGLTMLPFESREISFCCCLVCVCVCLCFLCAVPAASAGRLDLFEISESQINRGQ